MMFLHNSKAGSEVASILRQAKAKAGYCPRWMRLDNAPEYDSWKVRDFCEQNSIEHELSNEYQQHQNAAAETVVNMIGRGVRVLLLQLGLPPEFWGLAALHVVTVANCLPHASLSFDIPYTRHTGRLPDLSWFRSFWCSTVVHQGKDLVEHHKLVLRGDSGVFVGLGLMH